MQTPEFTARDRWLDRVSAVLLVICGVITFWALVETVVDMRVSPQDRAQIMEMGQ